MIFICKELFIKILSLTKFSKNLSKMIFQNHIEYFKLTFNIIFTKKFLSMELLFFQKMSQILAKFINKLFVKIVYI